jgi:dolichol kinase
MIAELLRKSIHLSSLWIPILYWQYNKIMMLSILVVLTFIYILLDYNKLKISFIKNIFAKFNMILREKEQKGNLTGASYMLVASCLTILFFDKDSAIISLLILIIADTNAAIFGKMIKSKKICGNKTLVGSIAFFITTIIIICFYSFSISYISFYYAVITAAILTYVELKSIVWKIDDNFSIPIIAGILLTLVNMIQNAI